MVGNLISKKSVLANIADSKGVHVSEIKAVDGMVIQHGQINGLKRKHKPIKIL